MLRKRAILTACLLLGLTTSSSTATADNFLELGFQRHSDGSRGFFYDTAWTLTWNEGLSTEMAATIDFGSVLGSEWLALPTITSPSM